MIVQVLNNLTLKLTTLQSIFSSATISFIIFYIHSYRIYTHLAEYMLLYNNIIRKRIHTIWNASDYIYVDNYINPVPTHLDKETSYLVPSLFSLPLVATEGLTHSRHPAVRGSYHRQRRFCGLCAYLIYICDDDDRTCTREMARTSGGLGDI